MLSERAHDLMDKAVLNTLDDKERGEWEEMLKDPAVRAEFEDHQLMSEILDEEENKQLREELMDFAARDEGNDLPVKSSRLFFTKIAASVALLAMAIAWWMLPTKQSIYTQYYSNYSAPIVARGEEQNPAMDAYRSGQWEEALNGMVQQHQPLSSIYLGCIYLNLKEISKAKQSFEQAESNEDLYIQKTAQWYLALVALIDAPKEKAIQEFESIAQTPGPYQQQAEELLVQLKSAYY